MGLRFLLPSLTVLSFLASCTPAYIAPPEGGGTAKLRVKATGPVPLTWVHTYKEPGCKGPQFFAGLGHSSFTDSLAHVPKGMLDGKSERDMNIAEQVIPAKPTTLLFSLMGLNNSPVGLISSTCNIAVTFPVREGEEYEVQYGISGNQCVVGAFNLREVNGKVERIRIKELVKETAQCIPTRF